MRDWLGAGDSGSYDDAVRGVCSTRCNQYLVNAGLDISCIQVYPMYLPWRAGEGILNIVFLGDDRVEDMKESKVCR